MKGTCVIDGCDKQVVAKGYCNAQYHRLKYGKDKSLAPVKAVERRTHCSVEGCTGKHVGYGFCYAHYESYKKHGDPLIHIPIKKEPLSGVFVMLKDVIER